MLFALVALALGAAPPAQPRQVVVELGLLHGSDRLTCPTVCTLEDQEASLSVGQIVDGMTYGSRIRLTPRILDQDGVRVKAKLDQTEKGTPPFSATLDRILKPGMLVRMPLGAWKGKEMVLYLRAREFEKESLKIEPPATKNPE